MKLVLDNAIGTCPLCGEDLEHNYDEHDDGNYFDVYSCPVCHIGVTYISPDDGRGEYHNYNDGEIEVTLEKDWPSQSIE